MDNQKMVHQLNQIAAYFEIYPQQRAEEGVEGHIRKFWEPRMRRQLIDYSGEGLHPLVRKAVANLRTESGGQA